MVEGLGPVIANDSRLIQPYLDAPIGQQVDISAYIGVPLTNQDGSLFGTLCAIDPSPQLQNLEQELPLIKLMAGLLSKMLANEVDKLEQAQEISLLKNKALTDGMTGVLNRTGWAEKVGEVQAAITSVGLPVGVMVLDLDCLKQINDTKGHAAGDDVLKQVVNYTQTCLDKRDIFARMGGDEFSIMLTNQSEDKVLEKLNKIKTTLADNALQVSIGFAMHRYECRLNETIETADANMYLQKKSRKCPA